MSKKDIYVLGTGLSHDGSVCLLKNGEMCVAIEKERITRIKHDGHNDTKAIQYCLDAAAITLKDIDLVVQNAHYTFFEYGNDFFRGKRIFAKYPDIPIFTISHHLAHAYSAIGMSPFEEMVVLVLDGSGNSMDVCIDKTGAVIPESVDPEIQHIYFEKDSYYLYSKNKLKTLYKDFSPFGELLKEYPMRPNSIKHSIGGVYHGASEYCFNNVQDVGKLMGLAPYGKPGVYNLEIFSMKDGRVFVNYDWMKHFRKPARTYEEFSRNFQYYADIAYLVQKEVEKAILYIVRSRNALYPFPNLAYTGGVALNAVANMLILREKLHNQVYITPAAGDNGVAIGCAYYGWLEVLKKERVKHNGNTCFGRVYPREQIENSLNEYIIPKAESVSAYVELLFKSIPKALKKQKLNNPRYTIQFMIREVGVYSLEFRHERVILTREVIPNPNASIYLDGMTLLNSLRDQNYLVKSFKEHKIIASGDVDYFLNLLDMQKLWKECSRQNNIAPNDKIRYKEEFDVVSKSAQLLAEGKVIGWFQDGSEFGPRALGHRSILADPRHPEIRDFINSKIKFREDFRPFAPSVLQEDISKLFDFSGESPYMILVAKIKDDIKGKVPSIVHVDNTCRIQTVTPDWNPHYYDLLKAFKNITGIPILLNTSFNKRGMPIVETPEDAINFFYDCALDCLVINNYIVYKDYDQIQSKTLVFSSTEQK